MNKELQQLVDDFTAMLQANALEVGHALKDDLDSVKVYVAERMQHLATCITEPGFDRALRAERDNVALKSAAAAIDRADNIDGRILGFIEGAIGIAARALSLL